MRTPLKICGRGQRHQEAPLPILSPQLVERHELRVGVPTAPIHRGLASFGNDHFEIFAGNDQRTILGDVEFVKESTEIGLERLACLRIDRRECLHDRAVVNAENLDPMLGRLIAEDKFLLSTATVAFEPNRVSRCALLPR
jgi:hypothetical protein